MVSIKANEALFNEGQDIMNDMAALVHNVKAAVKNDCEIEEGVYESELARLGEQLYVAHEVFEHYNDWVTRVWEWVDSGSKETRRPN